MRPGFGVTWAVVTLLASGQSVAEETPPAPTAPAAAGPSPEAARDAASAAPEAAIEVPADNLAPPPAPPLPEINVSPVVTTERRRRFNLIIAGVSTLLATYTADRLLARDLSQSPVSWVPFAGPWWILHEESSRPNPSGGLQALLVVDGLVQLSGLTLAITGTFLRYDRQVLRLTNIPPTSQTPSPSPP
jgi:hypothetical protein